MNLCNKDYCFSCIDRNIVILLLTARETSDQKNKEYLNPRIQELLTKRLQLSMIDAQHRCIDRCDETPEVEKD